MKESTISRGKKSIKHSKKEMLQTIGDLISDFTNVVDKLEEDNQPKEYEDKKEE